MEKVIEKVLLENKIIDKIKESDIKIKPKWHFVLQGALMLTIFLSLFLVSIFLLSFFLFKNRMLPPHEMQEVLFNMRVVSWLLVSLIFFIIGAISLFYAEYKIIYRKSSLLILGVLVVTFITLSFILDKMTMHDRLRQGIRDHRIPVIMDIYEDGFEASPRNIK